MVAKGHPNKVIADVPDISFWTVFIHMRRIFAKLGVGSRAGMVTQLLEIGALANNRRLTLDRRSAEVILEPVFDFCAIRFDVQI